MTKIMIELIEEYNAEEKKQAERLAELYRLISLRYGKRFVRFGRASSGIGEIWNNCWEMSIPDFTHAFIHKICQPIHDYNLGRAER